MYEGPRYRSIVFAFAGDSTITRCLDIGLVNRGLCRACQPASGRWRMIYLVHASASLATAPSLDAFGENAYRSWVHSAKGDDRFQST